MHFKQIRTPPYFHRWSVYNSFGQTSWTFCPTANEKDSNWYASSVSENFSIFPGGGDFSLCLVNSIRLSLVFK